MAIDDDATPIVCFLLQGQKKLLSLRLQIYETNSDVLFDVKPDMSWSIPAVSAAPVVVTQPGWSTLSLIVCVCVCVRAHAGM